MIFALLALIGSAAGSEDQLALALARQTSPPPGLSAYERQELDAFVRTLPPLSPSELSLLNNVAANVSRQAYDRMLAAKAQSYADHLSAAELRASARPDARLREAQRLAFERTSEALRGYDFGAEVRVGFCARAAELCAEARD